MKFSLISSNQLLVLVLITIILMLSDLSHQKPNIFNNKPLNNHYKNLGLNLPGRHKLEFGKFENYRLKPTKLLGGRNTKKNNFIAPKNDTEIKAFLNYDLTKLDVQNSSQIIPFYNNYKTLFNKTYKTKEEEIERVGIFKQTIVSINKHNADDCSHYTQGINEMSDMKWPEIQKQKFGFKRPIARNKTKKIKFDKMLKSSNSYDDNNIPLEWDWRKYGIVTPSINQGVCGCCWSFASASVLESHLMKVQIYEGNFDPNNQLYLSQQNLIDCSREYGTEGCDGGSSKDAFEYVQSANQLNTYNAYPYTGIPNNCYFNRGIDVEIREVNRITTGADDELVSAIYKHGPVTVSFDANINFMNYRSGIYEEPLCDPENISHYMVAVGYTPEYFIVKNSWGENWGEGGFIRVSRSKLNNCGISEQDYYPVLTNDVGTDQMRDKLKEIY